MMQDLYFQGTDSLPTVSFTTNGELKMTGRALPEDASKFFDPLIDWLKNLSADEVNMEINLDYFNTSVSKKLLDMFREINNSNTIGSVNLKWMYEDGDDEMLESGEIYQELLPNFTFTFHKYAESF